MAKRIRLTLAAMHQATRREYMERVTTSAEADAANHRERAAQACIRRARRKPKPKRR